MNKKQLLNELEKLPLDAPIEFRLNEQPLYLEPSCISIVKHADLCNVKKAVVDLEIVGLKFDLE